ncbi:MAG: efflux RND transporter permease subunit [Rhodomicrobium sp.]
MTKAFIHSPLTLLFLIACLALGVLGFMFTPRQEDPQIDVPMVDVFFQFPGASAEQVASLATDPLERMMSEIAGVKHVYSASQRGGGMVTVEFDVGQKMEPSLVRLYDKLSSNMDKIPPGVSQPLVKPKAVDDVPVVTLTLWSDSVDDASLRLVALEVMQHLKEVRSTSQSFIVGGRPEEVRVEVLPERLKGFGIGLDQLAGAIRAANERRDVGNVETAGHELQVYTGSFLHHAQDVERIVVGVRNSAPVYVRDVARVIEGPGEASSIVQYFTGPAAGQAAHGEKVAKAEGAAAVTIAIAKKSGTNGVTVAQEILDKVNSLKGRIIPDNVNVAVTRDYGKTANDKVNELFFKLTVATVAVSGLIYLFLGLRPMIVVGIIIPVVILLTVFGALLTGYTIDRVSLFALIFSIGILVDDATVVIENIYRRWLMHGRIDTPTTIDAVREVGNPTILATFTVIAALLPMGFVSGMMGPYMRPIPVLGSVAMLLSLFAAFMFTPWLAMRIRPSLKELDEMEKREHRLVARLDRFYRGLLGPLIDEPWKAKVFRMSIWAAFLACCALFYTENVSVKMLPMDNKPEFNIVVNMPAGTALPETANAIQQLVAKTKEIPEVAALQTYAGTASPYNFNGLVRHYYLRDKPWQGDIQVQLLDKSERKRSSHAIAVAARALLTPLARSLGARIAVIEMPPGPPVLQTVVAEVYGPDSATRRQVARDLTHIFEKANSIGDVDNYLQQPHDTLVFVADQLKAEHYNATLGDISRQLAFVMGGAHLGDAKLGYELETRPLVLQAPLEIRSNLARLGEVPVKTGSNSFVPLAELGSFVRQPQDDLVYHKDLRAIEYVTGEAVGALAAPVYAMIEVARLLHDYKTPDGVTMTGTLVGPPAESNSSGFEWTGEWTVTYETFRDMGLAFAAAIVLIYMLVVLEFGNFRLPGIIMAPIPLTLIGIIPGHWLLGAEFTATSMIGWIALAGIIVRNSILLVDFSKHAILAGTPIREAVIQSCRARTRPIIITSLALMGGSASIITDPIFQGMAISLLFGAAVSTALTLVVIPLACARAQGAYSTGSGDFDRALAATGDTAAAHAQGGFAPEPAPAAACAAAGGATLKERAAEAANAARLGVGKPLSWAGESIRALFGEGALKPVLVLQTLALAAWGFALTGWRALFSAPQGPALAAATASPSHAASGSAAMRVTSAAARMPAPQASKTSAPVASGNAGQESAASHQIVPAPAATAPVEAAAGQHTVEVPPSSPATATGALIESTTGPRTVELPASSVASAAGPAPAQSEPDTAVAGSTASEEPAGVIEPSTAALREEPGASSAAGLPAAAVLQRQPAAEAEAEHHHAAGRQLALARRRRRKALAKRAMSPAQSRRARPAIDPKGED